MVAQPMPGLEAYEPDWSQAATAAVDLRIHAQRVAKRRGVPEDVLLGVLNHESGLNPKAWGNGGGVGQFIDTTARQYGTTQAELRQNPHKAVDLAAQLLRDNADMLGGDYDKAAAAYFIGAGNIQRAVREGGGNWLPAADRIAAQYNQGTVSSYLSKVHGGLAASSGASEPSAAGAPGLAMLGDVGMSSSGSASGSVNAASSTSVMDMLADARERRQQELEQLTQVEALPDVTGPTTLGGLGQAPEDVPLRSSGTLRSQLPGARDDYLTSNALPALGLGLAGGVGLPLLAGDAMGAAGVAKLGSDALARPSVLEAPPQIRPPSVGNAGLAMLGEPVTDQDVGAEAFSFPRSPGQVELGARFRDPEALAPDTGAQLGAGFGRALSQPAPPSGAVLGTGLGGVFGEPEDTDPDAIAGFFGRTLGAPSVLEPDQGGAQYSPEGAPFVQPQARATLLGELQARRQGGTKSPLGRVPEEVAKRPLEYAELAAIGALAQPELAAGGAGLARGALRAVPVVGRFLPGLASNLAIGQVASRPVSEALNAIPGYEGLPDWAKMIVETAPYTVVGKQRLATKFLETVTGGLTQYAGLEGSEALQRAGVPVPQVPLAGDPIALAAGIAGGVGAAALERPTQQAWRRAAVTLATNERFARNAPGFIAARERYGADWAQREAGQTPPAPRGLAQLGAIRGAAEPTVPEARRYGAQMAQEGLLGADPADRRYGAKVRSEYEARFGPEQTAKQEAGFQGSGLDWAQYGDALRTFEPDVPSWEREAYDPGANVPVAEPGDVQGLRRSMRQSVQAVRDERAGLAGRTGMEEARRELRGAAEPSPEEARRYGATMGQEGRVPLTPAQQQRAAAAEERRAATEERRRIAAQPPAVREGSITWAEVVDNAEKLLREGGGVGRTWYPRVGSHLLQLSHQNVDEASRRAGMLAMGSPQNPVKNQGNQLLKGIGQRLRGEPMAIHTEVQNRRAEIMANGTPQEADDLIIQMLKEPLSTAQRKEGRARGLTDEQMAYGRKTANFFLAMLRHIDPARYEALVERAKAEGARPGVTVDMHVQSIFGFNPKKGLTDRQYSVVEEGVQDVADRMGWDYDEAQAAFFTADILRNPGQRVNMTPERAAEDYADALRDYEAVITWETAPGNGTPASELLATFPNWSYPDKLAFHADAKAAVIDPVTGVNKIAEAVGLPGGESREQVGFYEGGVNPGVSTSTYLGPDLYALADETAALMGYATQQTAVPWTRRVLRARTGEHNGYFLQMDRPLSPEEMLLMGDNLGPDFVVMQASDNRAVVVRLKGRDDFAAQLADSRSPEFKAMAKRNKVGHRRILEVADEVLGEDVTYAPTSAAFDGGYVENDWTVHPNGEAYLSKAPSYDPGHERSAVVRPVVDQARTSYTDAAREHAAVHADEPLPGERDPRYDYSKLQLNSGVVARQRGIPGAGGGKAWVDPEGRLWKVKAPSHAQAMRPEALGQTTNFVQEAPAFKSVMPDGWVRVDSFKSDPTPGATREVAIVGMGDENLRRAGDSLVKSLPESAYESTFLNFGDDASGQAWHGYIDEWLAAGKPVTGGQTRFANRAPGEGPSAAAPGAVTGEVGFDALGRDTRLPPVAGASEPSPGEARRFGAQQSQEGRVPGVSGLRQAVTGGEEGALRLPTGAGLRQAAGAVANEARGFISAPVSFKSMLSPPLLRQGLSRVVTNPVGAMKEFAQSMRVAFNENGAKDIYDGIINDEWVQDTGGANAAAQAAYAERYAKAGPVARSNMKPPNADGPHAGRTWQDVGGQVLDWRANPLEGKTLAELKALADRAKTKYDANVTAADLRKRLEIDMTPEELVGFTDSLIGRAADRAGRPSNRQAATMLNLMRTNWYKETAAAMEKAGITEVEPYRELRKTIEQFTQRGSWGQPGRVPVFFSTRAMSGRIQAAWRGLNAVARPGQVLSGPGPQREAAKAFVGMVTANVAMLGGAYATADALGLDPKLDWEGKLPVLQVGPHRWDPWAGLNSPVRFAAGVVIDTAKNPEGGLENAPQAAIASAATRGQKFLRGGLSPVLGKVADTAQGRDFTGQKFNLAQDVQSGNILKDLFAPFIAETAIEATTEGSPLEAAALAGPAFLSTGINSYTTPEDQADALAQQTYGGRKYGDLGPLEQARVVSELPKEARDRVQKDYNQGLKQRKSEAGYDNPSAIKAELDRKNPELDAADWLLHGGTVQSKAAADLVLRNGAARDVRLVGMDRAINQDDNSRKAWDDTGTMIDFYINGMVQAVAPVEIASRGKKDKAYLNANGTPKAFNQLTSAQRSAVTSGIHDAARESGELEAALWYWGLIETPHSTHLPQVRAMIAKYGAKPENPLQGAVVEGIKATAGAR